MPKERLGRELDGRYRLDRILGKGGMGVVYEARHTGTDRAVAVKVLLPQFIEHAEITKRFLREAKSAAALHHPNVVDVLDMGEDGDGSPYIVLEFLVGQTLHALLKLGPLDPERTLASLLPVMDALALAHDHGIVHRDVKPDNIFLAENNSGQVTPKLLDFGIAKLTQTATSLKTRTGMAMGTPHYMPPEQAQGARSIGPAADVWAMGAVLFRSLTGTLPVQAPDMTTLFMKLVEGKVTKVHEAVPTIPEHLAAAVDATLVVAPEARHGGRMRGLIGAVVEAAERDGLKIPDGPGRPWHAPPASGPPSRAGDDAGAATEALPGMDARLDATLALDDAGSTVPDAAGTLALADAAEPDRVARTIALAPPSEAADVEAEPSRGRPAWRWGAAVLLIAGVASAALVLWQGDDEIERPPPPVAAPDSADDALVAEPVPDATGSDEGLDTDREADDETREPAPPETTVTPTAALPRDEPPEPAPAGTEADEPRPEPPRAAPRTVRRPPRRRSAPPSRTEQPDLGGDYELDRGW